MEVEAGRQRGLRVWREQGKAVVKENWELVKEGSWEAEGTRSWEQWEKSRQSSKRESGEEKVKDGRGKPKSQAEALGSCWGIKGQKW